MSHCGIAAIVRNPKAAKQNKPTVPSKPLQRAAADHITGAGGGKAARGGNVLPRNSEAATESFRGQQSRAAHLDVR